jgi:hypothetical protein
MLTKSQKTGKITKKRAKNGRFPQNARLNGHARFKTGDFSTLVFVLGLGGVFIKSNKTWAASMFDKT